MCGHTKTMANVRMERTGKNLKRVCLKWKARGNETRSNKDNGINWYGNMDGNDCIFFCLEVASIHLCNLDLIDPICKIYN
jgi:hypothetical protein